jgi:hypothetical protein
VFDRWSDSGAGNGENPRTVRNVTADMELTVSYRAANPQSATGSYLARATTAGPSLWDLTGSYATSVGAHTLTLDLVHDTSGRLTGTGAYALAGAVPVEVPLAVSGRAKGRDGALTATLALRGVNAAAATSVSMALNLALNAATSQLSGPLTGSIKANGATEKVTETVMLNPSRPMDGAWTLIFDLHQSGRKVTGTAELTLSNQVRRTFVARGRTAGERVVLSLAGDPADPASRTIWIRTTITPLEGGWARLERLTGDAYGQTLGW